MEVRSEQTPDALVTMLHHSDGNPSLKQMYGGIKSFYEPSRVIPGKYRNQLQSQELGLTFAVFRRGCGSTLTPLLLRSEGEWSDPREPFYPVLTRRQPYVPHWLLLPAREVSVEHSVSEDANGA